MPEQLFSLVLDASRMCRKSHPCCKKNTLCILSNIPPCTFQVLTRAFELISPSEVGYWGKLDNLYNNIIFSTPLTAFYKINPLWEQATVTHYFPVCILISKCTCYYLGWERTVHLSPETEQFVGFSSRKCKSCNSDLQFVEAWNSSAKWWLFCLKLEVICLNWHERYAAWAEAR